MNKLEIQSYLNGVTDNIKNVLLAKCIFHSLTLHIVQKELIKYIKQYINAGFAISPLNNLYVKIVIIRKKRTRRS